MLTHQETADLHRFVDAVRQALPGYRESPATGNVGDIEAFSPARTEDHGGCAKKGPRWLAIRRLQHGQR